MTEPVRLKKILCKSQILSMKKFAPGSIIELTIYPPNSLEKEVEKNDQ